VAGAYTERGPGAPRGGYGAAGARPLTRLAGCPWGILWPGLSTSMPGSKARSKGFSMFSAESIRLLGGLPVWPIVTVLVGSAGSPE
jgi:hypothetical protein